MEPQHDLMSPEGATDEFYLMNESELFSTDSELEAYTDIDSQPPSGKTKSYRSTCYSSRPTNFGRSDEKNLNESTCVLQNGQAVTRHMNPDEYCSQFLKFTNKNPTTYHVVSQFTEILKHSGYTYLPESRKFDLFDQGGMYFTKRDDQSMVAFVVGGRWVPQNGIAGIGCHIDALTLKLKPCSMKSQIKGYELLGIAPYSGALNHLWLDRDLGIAGVIIYRNSDSGKVERKMITSGHHAICRIPSLAPHFGSDVSSPYNKESQMVPVMGFGVSDGSVSKEESLSPLYGKHSLSLLRYLAKLGNIKVSQMLSLDLDLFDVQEATRGGINHEFIFAPRIDDRLCAFSAVHALTEFSTCIKLEEYDGFVTVLLANHEEIGSATRTGAKGKLLNSVVERILLANQNMLTDVSLVFANSVLLSADVTHALNPNFTDAYLEDHYPLPNKGLVMKLDANGHVMTDSFGQSFMKFLIQKSDIDIQIFHVRNDRPSGGTIGPMLAVDTGARVIDVGLAQLSMHSIRAAAGYKEPEIGIRTFRAFFDNWQSISTEIACD